MGRCEWNQGLTLSPRYGNVFFVVFFKIVLLSVAVALALSI